MSRRTRTIAFAVPLMLGLAGCSTLDPLNGSAYWHPRNANEANLRLMVAVPSDLVRGSEPLAADGHGAARAVQRLRQDRVRPLPDSAISKIVPVSSGAAPAEAPAPAAAAEGG